MTAPAARMHEMVGAPTMPGCEDVPARCVVCAHQCARTAHYGSWQGSAFTGQDKLRGHGLSSRVCEPCIWAHSWVAPPDKPSNPSDAVSAAGRKAKGVNLRLFSHFWSERDGYVSLHKGEKAAMRDWLRARVDGETWWAAIADTGQKHTIPWVREQRRARGLVRFEERDVRVGDWRVVDVMTDALTAGVTKAEIAASIYTPRAWELAHDHVRALLELSESHDGSGWWSLALWLSQRDEAQVAARMTAEKAAKADKKRARHGRSTESGGDTRRSSGARTRDEARVSRSRGESTRSLESPARPTASSSEDVRDDRAAGDGVSSRAAIGSAQLRLFG